MGLEVPQVAGERFPVLAKGAWPAGERDAEGQVPQVQYLVVMGNAQARASRSACRFAPMKSGQAAMEEERFTLDRYDNR